MGRNIFCSKALKCCIFDADASLVLLSPGLPLSFVAHTVFHLFLYIVYI